MPTPRIPPSRSPSAASRSSMTRVRIDPAVCQLIRNHVEISFFDAPVANQVTVSSNGIVCPASWRAQGTALSPRHARCSAPAAGRPPDTPAISPHPASATG